MTTPQEARELAEHYADTSLAKSTLFSLANQVEALTAELESWRFTNRIDELQRAHDSYKKDAERYRFMRLQDGVTLNMSWAMPFPKNHIHGQPMSCHSSMHGNGEMLDKMVDATIAKGTA